MKFHLIGICSPLLLTGLVSIPAGAQTPGSAEAHVAAAKAIAASVPKGAKNEFDFCPEDERYRG